MKSSSKEKKSVPSVPEEDEFKGYTMEELRYQRALLLVKREFLRDKALKETKKIKEQIPVINGQSSMSGLTTKGVVSKIVKGLDFADYLMLGFQALRIGKKVGTLFKRK